MQRPASTPGGKSVTISPQIEQALTILAAPDARVRVSSWRSHCLPGLVMLLRHGDWVVQSGFEAGTFYLGTPVAIPALVEYLAAHLASGPLPTERRDLLISPKMLVGISWLWSYGQRSATDRVRAKDLEKRLTESRIEDAPALLAELVDASVLEATGTNLSLGREWVPRLSRIWSAEYAEVELCLLPQEHVPTTAEIEATQARMLFVGPRDQRLLLQYAPVDERGTARAPDKKLKPGDLQLAFSHLADDELRQFLTGLLTRSRSRESVDKGPAAA
jgi:hypothetical protein